MWIPAGFRADFTVFIGHNDVRFPSGLAGELKGHVGEPAHVGFAALANLHKLEITSHHLVVGGVPIPELDDLAVLSDLERAHGLIRVEVTPPGLLSTIW